MVQFEMLLHDIKESGQKDSETLHLIKSLESFIDIGYEVYVNLENRWKVIQKNQLQ